MSSPQSSRKSLLSLQNKVLLLVLLPLLIVSITLVSISSYNRLKGTEATLAKQRETLIEARKKEMRSVIEAAKTSIAPIVAGSGLDDVQAQELAKSVLRSIRFDAGNHLFVYDNQGINLVHPTIPSLENTNLFDKQDKKGNYLIRDMIQIAKNGDGYYQYYWPHPGSNETAVKYSYVSGIEKWGWMLGAGVFVADIDAAMAQTETFIMGKLRRSMLTSATIAFLIFVGVAGLAYWLTRRSLQPMHRTAAAMQDIAEGKGDLTRRLNVERHDEIGNLAIQFNAFVERMQNTLKEVRSSTRSVNRAAGDMAQGSDELATRTEQAAANLQETSASMEEITSTVSHSADSAQQANQLVQSTADVARQGEAVMGQVERTMEDINTSAIKIGEIITMIDAIAFQTNILALNASVEAARAGEHGRGFAVVAQEVRILASRSSDASSEIRTLIDTSASHTKSGAELVRNAGQTMQEIVASVARVTDVIGEISAATKEQSQGIGQVNTAVMEMDSMTQQNAAMVQQSSTAATDMRRHAQHLSDLINTFVLGEETAIVTHKTAKASALSSTPKQSLAKQPKREEVEEWSDF